MREIKQQIQEYKTTKLTFILFFAIVRAYFILFIPVFWIDTRVELVDDLRLIISKKHVSSC